MTIKKRAKVGFKNFKLINFTCYQDSRGNYIKNKNKTKIVLISLVNPILKK